MNRLMQWFGRHPVWTLLAIGAISAASFGPAGRVRIATSIDSLMMENDPERAYYLETRSRFGSEAMAVVYVEDPELFSPDKLEVLHGLVLELEGIPGILSSESLFSITHLSNRGGELDIHPLIGWPPDNAREADAIRKRAMAHPVVDRLLLSAEGDATAIHLRIDTESSHADEMRPLSHAIEQVLAPHLATFSRLQQLGRPYVIERETAYILRDQRTILPLAIVVLVLMLVLILSSFKGAVLPLLTSGVSILWTLAFMGLAGIPITELTFMVPSLLLVIGSTEDIHLLAEYRSGRMSGLDRHAATQRMSMRLAVAVMFTALTTFSGFATIVASPIPVLREFGIAASAGLLINPLVTISLIPACLALFPDRGDRIRRNAGITRIEEIVLRLLSRVRLRPKTTLALVCAPCLAAGLYGAMHVRADNNIIGFFRPDSPVVERIDRLGEKLSGAETFCIRIDADAPEAFKKPENLHYAMQLQQHLAETDWVDRSISLTDYLSYVHRAFTESDAVLPDSMQSVAEYLLLLHRSEIEPYVSADFGSLNIVVRHNLRSSRELMPRIKALREYIASSRPEDLQVGVTGEMLLIHKAVQAIVRGQLRSIVVIAVIAAVLLSLLFRSARIGCIALIPNLLPIGIQFGFMAVMGIPLNTATSMAAAISIGLGVDDTIHLLIHFYRQDPALPPAQAVARSLRHLVRPVIATTTSLALGFLVMRFSSFTPIADFALLAALVLAAALICDLLVTPTLLSMDFLHPPRTPRNRHIEQE